MSHANNVLSFAFEPGDLQFDDGAADEHDDGTHFPREVADANHRQAHDALSHMSNGHSCRHRLVIDIAPRALVSNAIMSTHTESNSFAMCHIFAAFWDTNLDDFCLWRRATYPARLRLLSLFRRQRPRHHTEPLQLRYLVRAQSFCLAWPPNLERLSRGLSLADTGTGARSNPPRRRSCARSIYWAMPLKTKSSSLSRSAPKRSRRSTSRRCGHV